MSASIGVDVTPRDTIRLGYPGGCPPTGRLAILLFDDSASISTGDDAIGRRYVETEAAFSRIGRGCRCDRELAAVVHFGTPSSLDVAPTPMGGRGLARLQRGLGVPPDGVGVSLLRPALRVAETYARIHAQHVATLVVLSDFQLDDDTAGLADDLAGFRGDVHAIVLRSAPPPELLDEPRIAVTAVGYDTAPGTLSAALFAVLTTGRPDRRLRSGTEEQP
jgi:hypothetical protein